MGKKIVRIAGIIASIITGHITSDPLCITRYFWANYQHFQKKPTEAEFWFTRLFEEQVPFAAYEGYVQFLFATKKFSLIYSMKDLILTRFPSNVPLLLTLADVLTLYKEEVILNDTFLQLHQKYPDNPNLTLRVVSILLERKDFDGAIARIDALLNKTSRLPTIFLFHFMKAQMYLQLNRIEDAIFATKKSTELFCSFDKSWLVLGILCEQLGNTKDAIHAYQQYASCSEKPSPLFSQRPVLLELQHNQLKETIKSDEARCTCKDLIQTYITKKEYGDAMRYINATLEYEPDNREIKKLKVMTLVHQKQHKTACDMLQACIHNDVDHRTQWIELSQQLALAEKDMVQHIDAILQKYQAKPSPEQLAEVSK